MTHSFKQTLLAFKQKKMFFLFLLGISSGLPFALTWGTLQTWMTEAHVDLKTIGLFAFLRIPFSLKFIWSPIMDRYQIPILDRRRGWVLLSQLLVAVTLLAVSWTDPKTQTHQLVLLALLCNFFAASQDIVLDAYRRDILSDAELGIGTALFVDGYLLAFRFISGAGAIFLSNFISWGGVYQIMAGIMVVMTVPLILSPSEKLEMESQLQTHNQNVSMKQTSLIRAFVDPLRDYFSNSTAWTVLAFIVLYKLGDNIALNMTIPFVLNNGFSKDQYVAASKILGLGATILGGAVGGIFVHRFGIFRSLLGMGILQAFSNMGFLLLSNAPGNTAMLLGVIGFENFAVGMGTTAQAAFMAANTSRRYSVTQYALLSSLMAVPGIVFASRAGDLAERLGWSQFFIFCGLLSIPGLFLIPFLKQEDTGSVNDYNRKLAGTWQEAVRRTFVVCTMAAVVYAMFKSIADFAGLK